MRWAVAVPMYGGQVVGSIQAIGSDPEVIASYAEFEGADRYTQEAFPQIPFRHFNDGYRMPKGLDMIVSVCPCAGLSMLSQAKTGSDARAASNRYMMETAQQIMGEAKPKVYLGENAPNLFTAMGAEVAKFLFDTATANGYTMSLLKTDPTFHGLPQRRPRTFYFFWRKDSPSESAQILPISKSDPGTVEQFLAGLPEDAPNRTDPSFIDIEDDTIYHYLKSLYGDKWRTGGEDGKPYSNAWQVIDKKQKMRDYIQFAEQNFEDPERDHVYRAAKRLMVKMMEGKGVFVCPPTFDKDGTYPAIMSKTIERLVHPTEDRYLNIREATWLMGLPSDYPITTAGTQRRLCQNVPVNTGRHATEIALKYLDGQLEPSGSDMVWVDEFSERTRFGWEKNRPEQVAHREVFA